jgi:hypothetical protein
MNERIKELIEQSTKRREVEGRDGYTRLYVEFDKEKFAELLINECIKLMDETVIKAADNNTYMGEDVPTMVHQSNIKKHFGVV